MSDSTHLCSTSQALIPQSEKITIILGNGYETKMNASHLSNISKFFRDVLIYDDYDSLMLHSIYLGDVSLNDFLSFEQFIVSELDHLDPINLVYARAEREAKTQGGSKTEFAIDKDGIKVVEMDHLLDAYVHLFCLGEYIQCPKFQNAVMEKLVGRYRDFYVSTKETGAAPLRNVKYIYEHTSEGSPLRKLIADVLNYVMSDDSRDQAISAGDFLTEEIVQDILASGKRVRKYKCEAPWDHLDEYQTPELKPLEKETSSVGAGSWDHMRI